jgi:hypothetical protein
MFKFVLGMAGLALAFNLSAQLEPNAGRWLDSSFGRQFATGAAAGSRCNYI